MAITVAILAKVLFGFGGINVFWVLLSSMYSKKSLKLLFLIITPPYLIA